MEKYTVRNKVAWEYDAYKFWVSQNGVPAERAKLDLENPRRMLKRFAKHFENIEGLKIANICGSCGKKAVPLAILGANVAVFDISEQNKKYACETAEGAGVHVEYVVGDVLDIDMSAYGECFDIVFMEGGILHYFHDIDKFVSVVYSLLKPEAKLILSDFHPFTKIVDVHDFGNILVDEPDYFSKEIVEGEMAHARFYDEEKRKLFPKCLLRRYTLSEIINAVISKGFIMKSFDEHPSWTNEKLPGEFTILGVKPR